MVNVDSRRLRGVEPLSHHGIDPAVAFLHRFTEKHDVADTEFLADGAGYLTSLFRQELSSHLNYAIRNHIGKWVQALAMRIDRFHAYWWDV